NARPNLDAILAEVDLAAAETELASLNDRQSILRKKILPVLDRYDVVMMDCPPSLGLLTINALALAQEVIVPMQAHFLALQGVGRLLETVGLVCQSVNPKLQVAGIILCMHESQTTLAKEIVTDLESFFEQAANTDVPWRNCRVLRPAIRRNIKLAEAPSFGKTIFDYAADCPGAADYRMLADDLMQTWTQRLAANLAKAQQAPAKLPVPSAQVVETKPVPISAPLPPQKSASAPKPATAAHLAEAGIPMSISQSQNASTPSISPRKTPASPQQPAMTGEPVEIHTIKRASRVSAAQS
ncbi:MAG TPA: AAA family ATPase, partial [Phycisphaerales bacterium]|nr:AAA family ATPase [Phycisphaerales bacterium]